MRSDRGKRLEHVMEHCQKVRNFIHGPFVASEYTGLLPSRTSVRWCLAAQNKDTLVFHPHPFPPAQLGDGLLDGTGFLHQGIRHFVFYRKALMAGWQVRCGGGLEGPPSPRQLCHLRMGSCLCFSSGQPWFYGCGWLWLPSWLLSSSAPGWFLGFAHDPGGCLLLLRSSQAGT